MDVDTSVPNHHADFPQFRGVPGYIAALTMVVGRTNDADLAIDLTGVRPGDVVVDVGCGTGTAARRAAARGAAEVVAVDPSPQMLRVARLLTRRRPAVRYVEGAAESLPLPDAAATVVWSLATVHHWRDVDQGLAEVHRVLRPGGRFLVSERVRREGSTGLASHGWTPAQSAAFAAACERYGFVAVRDERHGDRLTVLAGR